MEKILLALNSQDIDLNAIRFACYLTKLTHSKLTGIFLENLVTEEEIVINIQQEAELYSGTISIMKNEPDEELFINNVRLFREIAEQEGVEGFIELDEGIPAREIVGKTRFADLLIVDAKTSFSTMNEYPPTRFLKDVLLEAECPVVISPESFSGIDTIVFCYNSTKSSVFAIKQFLYLFPEQRNRNAKIFHLAPGSEYAAEEEPELIDWLKYHFADAEVVPYEGSALNNLFNYLRGRNNDFIVMGAYGRGLLDSFFQNTRTTRLPVFVSHY